MEVGGPLLKGRCCQASPVGHSVPPFGRLFILEKSRCRKALKRKAMLVVA